MPSSPPLSSQEMDEIRGRVDSYIASLEFPCGYVRFLAFNEREAQIVARMLDALKAADRMLAEAERLASAQQDGAAEPRSYPQTHAAVGRSFSDVVMHILTFDPSRISPHTTNALTAAGDLARLAHWAVNERASRTPHAEDTTNE